MKYSAYAEVLDALIKRSAKTSSIEFDKENNQMVFYYR
jgi:hypothetical protein